MTTGRPEPEGARCLSSSARCCSSARASGSSASSPFPKPRRSRRRSRDRRRTAIPCGRTSPVRAPCAPSRRRRIPGDALRLSRHGRQHGRRADVRGLRPRYRGGDRRAASELSGSRARRPVGLVRCGLRARSTTGSRRARSARCRDGAPQSVGTLGDHAREGAHQALLRAAARLEGILVEAPRGTLRAGRGRLPRSRGNVCARAVASATSCPPEPSEAFQDRMAAGLRAFPAPLLLILSGDDLTAKEFLEYAQSDAGWQRSPAARRPRAARSARAPTTRFRRRRRRTKMLSRARFRGSASSVAIGPR